MFAEQEGDGVGLLPTGTGGTPDIQLATCTTLFDQHRQDGFAKCFEGMDVAKKRGLGRYHRLDYVGEERRIAVPFADGDQNLLETPQLMFFEDGGEPLANEVFLSRFEDQAALLVQQTREEFESRRRDERLSHGLDSRVG